MPLALAATQDPISQAIVAAIIVGVFTLLVLEKAHRVLIIFAAVALLWLITYFTPYHLIGFEAAQRAIDFNVILLLASMMALVGVLRTTGVFGWVVGRLMRQAGGRPGTVLALLIWFTGILSALADNVTTVIFVFPMLLALTEATGLPLAALALPAVIASNIGGTATLIGDPPNILIGSGAGLSFWDFVENLTVPVLLMLVLCVWFSRRYFRAELAKGHAGVLSAGAQTITNPLLLRWGLAITALVFVGFFTHELTGMPAAVPAAIGAALMLLAQDVIYLRSARESAEERIHGILDVLERSIEWPTLAFFAFLFIAVGAAVETGLIDTLARGLEGFIALSRRGLGLADNGALLFAALLVLWASGLLSALIDNIPYVAVTIPVIGRIVHDMPGDTEILWWALALGACLGGNGSVIGASANVTVVGMADRAGQRISFRQFGAYGIPMTLITLLVASVFLAAHLLAGKLPTFLAGLGLLAGVLAWSALRRTPTVHVSSTGPS